MATKTIFTNHAYNCSLDTYANANMRKWRFPSQTPLDDNDYVDADDMVTALKAVKSDFCFVHLTAYSNLDSIESEGAIYSLEKLRNKGIEPKFLSNDLSRYLDARKYLQDFVRLSLTPNMATFKRFYERANEFAMLFIRPEILYYRRFWVTPINAAANGVTAKAFYELKDSLDLAKIINLSYIPGYGNENFYRSQAEVLIEGDIPLEFVEKIDRITR